MKKKIDIASLPVHRGSSYPSPFGEPCRTRERRRLGEARGMNRVGVNLLTLPPGAWSSQRHWHSGEDEFVWILEGEVVLVTNAGEEILRAGDCAAFPAGEADGHHLINRSEREARLLEVGDRGGGVCTYSDIDMVLNQHGGGFARKTGEPYPPGS
ncbi:MAG: cupin domain-containing protein [Caulobacteraceae bacterium]